MCERKNRLSVEEDMQHKWSGVKKGLRYASRTPEQRKEDKNAKGGTAP
jgi:hypothetical protein